MAWWCKDPWHLQLWNWHSSANIVFWAGLSTMLWTLKGCPAHIGHELCIPCGSYCCHGNNTIWYVNGLMCAVFRNVNKQHCFAALLTMTNIVHYVRCLGLHYDSRWWNKQRDNDSLSSHTVQYWNQNISREIAKCMLQQTRLLCGTNVSLASMGIVSIA